MKRLSPIFILSGVMAFAITGKLLVSAVQAGAPMQVTDSSEPQNAAETPARSKNYQSAIDPAANCPASSSELAELLARASEEYRERKAILNQRETEISESREIVDSKLAELRSLKNDLSRYIETIERSANEDITALSAMYAAMKPQQAGALFDQMAPEFAAGFLRTMNPESAASILASMDTAKAYAVSVHIAGQAAEKSNQLK